MDRWTARFLVREMCKWAKANPGCVPTFKDVGAWVRGANAERVDHRAIIIANTPDKLTLRVALAITGGAYHEAFHTLYSCLRDVGQREVADFVIPRWAKVKDWSKFQKALLQWANIIEDIRIERRGREEFEGVFVKLADLQDFILHQEEKGIENLRGHGMKPGALSVIEGCFRDVGLGYNTEKQRFVMDRYRQDHAKAVKMVLEGPLTPFLRESIALPADDDLGCIRLAMDVVAEIAEHGGEADEDEQAKNGPGDGEQACPKCGAPAKKLKVRPKSDGKGGKVRGKGIVTCTVCGWQDEVDVEAKPQQPQPGDSGQSGDGPEFEGFDEDDVDQPPQQGQGGQSGDDSDDGDDDQSGSGGGGKSEDKDGKDGTDEDDSQGGSGSGDSDDGEDPEDGSGGGGDGDDKDGEDSGDKDGAGGSGGKDKDDDTSDGKDPGGKDKTDDPEDGDGDGDSEDGEDGKPKPKQGKDGEDSEDGDGQQTGQKSDDEGDTDEGGDGAGGHGYDDKQHPGNEDWSNVAEEAIDQTDEDTGLLDNNAALSDAVGNEQDKEDRDVEGNEAPWRPYDPGLDEIVIVGPSAQGRDHDDSVALQIIRSVTREAAWLRARLRSVVRSLEMTSTFHGVPKGRRLSPRYLVDSKAALRNGQSPTKAYSVTSHKIDMSMACCVVLDESSSMSSRKKDASRIMVALTEPFDALNCPTMALGFRNGAGGYSSYRLPPDEQGQHYHRYEGVVYDIFKMWHERFNAVRYRFANTRATGSTPMSDGIQFALDALSLRDEAHRFLFVVTDGCPDGGHEAVIKRQIRLGKQAGVHVVGVGMGSGAQYVKTLFADYVYSDTLSGIPKELVRKLNELVDIRGGKRGRRVKKTG